MIIHENIILAPHTVFKIGGAARYFCEAQSLDEIREAIVFAREHELPFFMLGAGSNILVSDDGYYGLVIKINVRDLIIDNGVIQVGAGLTMARAVNFAVGHGLVGFEWGVGVPGTIGGSIFGNAGCYGGEMSQIVDRVSVLDTADPSLKTFELSNNDCHFAYRHSIFKQKPNWIIVSATLHLQSGDHVAARAKVLEFSQARIAEKPQTSGNMGAQEIGAKCAGCIFKNPEPEMAAGFLIDTSGLKGLAVGGAMVSKKHANFIINTGHATARDIKALIKVVKEKVKKFHGVELEEEVRFLG
jgi:UDP-N-acetylmuramate dehydrogenase